MAETDRKPVVGYLVSAWPRLSETFILNEVLAAERLGTALRLFSLKDPGPAPVHDKVRQVRARLYCLAGSRHLKSAVLPSLRLLSRHPVRYFRTLREVIRHGRRIGKRRFVQAVCLADLLEREPVDHVHAHFANAPAVVAMLVHELTGVPFTFTAHAKDIYVKTPREVLRDEIRRARAVVTCTEYNRQFLKQLEEPEARGTSRLHRIYHGLDLSEFPFGWPHNGVEKPPLILTVARLVEKKGLGELLSAARLLKHRGRCFQVRVIGDGPLRAALEVRTAELGLQDRVEFTGALPHNQVRAAYARASAFALPCVVASDGDRDGIPNVLLEAMASGVPVVSTPVSGIPELIESEREGLLVEPGSARALADALDRLLGDARLCERLVRAGRAKIEESFSLERNCAQLLQHFPSAPGTAAESLKRTTQPSVPSEPKTLFAYRGQS